MSKDVNESRRVRKLVRGRAQQCYWNAFQVVQRIPEYSDAEYVEGMAVNDDGLAIEHGWVERNGVIIDPTLPEDQLVYFPGLKFKGLHGLSEALRISKPEWSEDLPIFYRFGWGGVESPEFRSALIAAYRFNGLEDLARRYENYEVGKVGLPA
jgi:hypothetical protein